MTEKIIVLTDIKNPDDICTVSKHFFEGRKPDRELYVKNGDTHAALYFEGSDLLLVEQNATCYHDPLLRVRETWKIYHPRDPLPEAILDMVFVLSGALADEIQEQEDADRAADWAADEYDRVYGYP